MSSAFVDAGGFLGSALGRRVPRALRNGSVLGAVGVGGFLTANAPSESCSVLIWPKVFAKGRAAPWLAELTRRSLTFALTVAAQWGCVVNPSTRVGKSGRGRLVLGYARGLLRLGHNERKEAYCNTLAQLL